MEQELKEKDIVKNTYDIIKGLITYQLEAESYWKCQWVYQQKQMVHENMLAVVE